MREPGPSSASAGVLPPGAAPRNSMLIIIVLLAFLSGVYIGSRFFAAKDVD